MTTEPNSVVDVAPHAPVAAASPPFVVGIGASAGGLEALEAFFEQIPLKSGMAFVVIQHLSPDFKSLMDEILRRRTEIPIHLVEDGMRVQADHVYLIPPKKEMIIVDGRLLLSERDREQELSLPIDVFFRSLAEDCGARAIAVVLSGGGSDGSRGIRAVHEAGGLVVIQDVDSAQFDGMPKTARDAGVADVVLPPAQMPRVLVEHVRQSVSGVVAPTTDGTPLDGMNAVYKMLQDEFGLDFTHYKPSTVTRRIERRLRLAHTNDIDEYVARLRREGKELDVLYRDLLIGVTRFFRDVDAFAALENNVLPELIGQGAREQPLRVWVAGCATGEEVYSLAILLHELSARDGNRPFKIFATDVHHGSLETATRGVYGEDAVIDVSPERLERYFLRRGRTYEILPELRQTVVFAHHNVIKDAPFTRVDLVSCRNMLIYLQPAAQQKVMSLFHFALNRGGVMVLGPSESPGAAEQDFEIVDKKWRIYRKYSDRRMQVDPRLQPSTPRFARPLITPSSNRHSVSQLLGTYDALLDEFMPPSLLLDEHYELVHAFGGASKFLGIKDGRQGLDVLELVEPELKMVVMGGVQRALKDASTVVFKGVRAAGDVHKVSVRRVQGKRGAGTHVLVTFEGHDGAGARPASASTEHEIDLGDVSRQQLAALEAELGFTKDSLQVTTEQLESSNEELQAANEELLASNEELQSTNEELQSVNEELYSVNAEYQRKIADLTELGNDMENLLSATDIGTIFLDTELKIRKFTPQVGESFNLLPQDVGRPIEAFTYAVDHPELTQDLKRVLATGERVERELRDRHNRAFFLRILPYRAKGTVAGVVLTLIDVSGLKAAEDALFHERYLLNSLLFSVPDAIYFKDARGRFIRANHAMADRLGLGDPREAAGKTGFELPSHQTALEVHKQDEMVLRTGEAQHYKLERRAEPDGNERWDLVTRLPLYNAGHQIVGIIGIFRDITEQKQSEAKITDAVRRRDEFLAMLSHELRNPLGAIVTATSLLKHEAAVRPPVTVGGLKPIEVLERQSQQMARLLDDLLEASRVTQDKIRLRQRDIDLRTVVSEAADAVRSAMARKKLAFQMTLDPQPLWVHGDPARLQQVVVNLLNNAAKYTDGHGHVWLSAQRGESAHVVIKVRDDGVGIPKEMLESAFELFVQSKRTLDRADGGLGVGLTLVRGLVAKHGGTVVARSDGEGKGTEIEVRLPLIEQPIVVPTPPRRPRRALPPGARIVVVEDNADSRDGLCSLLRLAGYECHASGHGMDGLALIEQVKPHAAIVDIGLPGIDGMEFARRVRAAAASKETYLIAVTGYGQPEDRTRVMGAGFDEHLVKPVDFVALERLLSDGPADRSAPPSPPPF